MPPVVTGNNTSQNGPPPTTNNHHHRHQFTTTVRQESYARLGPLQLFRNRLFRRSFSSVEIPGITVYSPRERRGGEAYIS